MKEKIEKLIKNREKRVIFLILILIFAFLIRFYQLDIYPALNADEAAIGYNAYSLIQTGQDEHSHSWPIHFQSFNDYKPGLFFYLVLPFVKILGLNEWAVRIPGAFLGTLSILIIYLLVKELLRDKRVALISALFLAISPWQIHFSRGGWEVNAATFFITLGFWLFIKAFAKQEKGTNKELKSRQKTIFLILSIVSFTASIYTYHAARLIAPLLGLGLFAFYFKEIKKKENLKPLIISLVVGLVLVLPLAKDLLGPEMRSRAAGVGIFADPGPLNRINEQRGEHQDFQSLGAKILHNRPVNYTLAFFQNWLEHYWGEFLFLSGDEIQRNRAPETGQLYLFDLPLILISLYLIINLPQKKRRKWSLIFFWLLIAPIPAALTFQSPHALRAQNMVIPLTVVSAFGLVGLIDWLKETIKDKKIVKLIYLLIAFLISLCFGRYLHMYWVHLAKEYPFSSQYGLKELVNYLKENQEKYQKIIITDRYDQPYVLTLFYLQYPPEKFQKEHQLTGRDQYGFSTVRNFDKYEFVSIKYDQMYAEYPNSLLIGTDEEIPDAANMIKEIYGSNEHLYFQVVAN